MQHMQPIKHPIYSLRHSTLLALLAGTTFVSGNAWAQPQEAGERAGEDGENVDQDGENVGEDANRDNDGD